MTDTFADPPDPSTTTEPKLTDPGQDLGQGQVQAQIDQETEQGYRGTKVDPTPNEHYTFQGVVAGLPTPETDRDHAAAVAAELRNRD